MNYIFQHSFEQEEEENSGYKIMNGSVKYWKSGGGSRDFTIAKKMNDLAAYLLTNYNPVKEKVNSTTKSSKKLNDTLIPYFNKTRLYFNKTRLLMSSSGEIEYLLWDSGEKIWQKSWSAPQTRCSIYNACGNFGCCKDESGFTCECLPGFEPAVRKSWDSGDYNGGCSRKSSLCEKETNYTFLSLSVIEVVDANSLYEQANNEEMCKEECLNKNCQCQAYSFWPESRRYESESTYGCYIWTAELADLQLGLNAAETRNISVKITTSTSGMRCVYFSYIYKQIYNLK